MSRTRETTSVSTLVNKANNLVTHAKITKAHKDVLKQLILLKLSVAKFEAEYNSLKSQVKVWEDKFFPKADVNTSAQDLLELEIMAELAELEAETE